MYEVGGFSEVLTIWLSILLNTGRFTQYAFSCRERFSADPGAYQHAYTQFPKLAMLAGDPLHKQLVPMIQTENHKREIGPNLSRHRDLPTSRLLPACDCGIINLSTNHGLCRKSW